MRSRREPESARVASRLLSRDELKEDARRPDLEASLDRVHLIIFLRVHQVNGARAPQRAQAFGLTHRLQLQEQNILALLFARHDEADGSERRVIACKHRPCWC